MQFIDNKALLVVVCAVALSFLDAEARLEQPIAASAYSNADAIGVLDGKDIDSFQSPPPSFRFVRGSGNLPFPLPMTFSSTAVKHYALFFKSSSPGHLAPINQAYTVGFSSDDSSVIASLGDPKGIGAFLVKAFAQESDQVSRLQQAYLLCELSNPEYVQNAWSTIKDKPTLDLADANIGVRAIGVAALSRIKSPLANLLSPLGGAKTPFSGNPYEVKSILQLTGWIYRNANAEDHDALLTFAGGQSGLIQASTLTAASRYCTAADTPLLVKISQSTGDILGLYGCFQCLAYAAERPDLIPTIDGFKHKSFAEWQGLLSSK